MWDRDAYGLWFIRQDPGGRYSVAKPVNMEFESKTEGAWLLPDPTIQLRPEEAVGFFQGIKEGMIEAGLAHSDEKIAGELEATKKHLEDMRLQMHKLLERPWK